MSHLTTDLFLPTALQLAVALFSEQSSQPPPVPSKPTSNKKKVPPPLPPPPPINNPVVLPPAPSEYAWKITHTNGKQFKQTKYLDTNGNYLN